MSESAYLRRSLSQPTGSSREEGDRLRCLSESVSFGRFVGEPLGWDRWSNFPHNRYLEEAERYSRPGSVAEKRAYFEAHFKRKAEERAAAALALALLEASSGAAEPSSTVREDENREGSGSAEGESFVDESKKGRDEEDSIQESCDQDKIDFGVEDNMILISEECSAQENTTSASQERSAAPPKVLLSPAKQTNRAPAGTMNSLASSTSNKFAKGSADRKSEKSIHMSINFSSRTDERSKRTTSPTTHKTRSSKSFFSASSLNVQAKAKASENGTQKRTLPNLKSEDGRSYISRPIVTKSVAGGITADSSTENSKPSYGQASKPRSSIAYSPFNLRSEERAAKRKEFYEKLEERRNAEEATKKHPQTKYQPKSPKFGKKPSNNKTADSKNSHPSATTKAMSFDNDRSKKNTRENSSPNIENSASKKS